MAWARHSVGDIRKRYRERLGEIEEYQKERAREAADKLKEAKRRKQERLEKITNEIIYYGLWQTEKEVDERIVTYSRKTELVAALKAQLNFRQHVLGQSTGEATDFTFSYKVDGKVVQVTPEDLTKKLKKLVLHAYTLPQVESEGNTSHLVRKRVTHKFDIPGEGEKWFPGTVISQVPGYPDWLNIKYDDEEGVFTYKLLEDLKNGNLKLIIDN